MKVFKIKKYDDLFSMGKECPQFGKEGEIWLSLSNLRQHLTMVTKYWRKHLSKKQDHPYEDCSIIEYSLKEENTTLVMEELLRSEEIKKEQNIKRRMRFRSYGYTEEEINKRLLDC